MITKINAITIVMTRSRVGMEEIREDKPPEWSDRFLCQQTESKGGYSSWLDNPVIGYVVKTILQKNLLFLRYSEFRVQDGGNDV